MQFQYLYASLIGRAVADVLVVVPGRGAGAGRQRHPALADELHRHLVQADQRPPLVVGPVVVRSATNSVVSAACHCAKAKG
jgi:hypothetical protein